MPELDRLARATRETTGLGVLDGDQFLTVAQADGPNLVAMGDWTGRGVPPHSVAAGKVLMAALPEREIMRLVRRGLDQLTDRTITELEPLLEELARVRRRGYATAFGEYDSRAQRGRGAGVRRPRPGRGRRRRLGPVVPRHARAASRSSSSRSARPRRPSPSAWGEPRPDLRRPTSAAGAAIVGRRRC